MTDYEEQLELLTAYLDEEVTPAERAQVEALLEKDPEARRLLDELRQTSALVAALPGATAPGHFSDNVVARLEREALLGAENVPPQRWTLGNWSALAASIVLVAAAGWYVVPRLDQFKSERVAQPAAMREGDVVAVHSPAPRDNYAAPAESLSEAKHDSANSNLMFAHNAASAKSGTRPGAASIDADGAMTGAPQRSITPEPMVPMKNSPNLLDNCVLVDEAAEVDQSLKKGRLTPGELEKAPEAAFTNRITLEVPDPSAVNLVQRVVESNLASNFVKNLDHAPKDQPIDRGSSFYARQDNSDVEVQRTTKPAGPSRSSMDRGFVDSAAPDVCQIVINVPRGQAREMIAAVQSACSANGFESNIDVNGLRFDNNADPDVVTDKLVTIVDSTNYDDSDWEAGVNDDKEVAASGESSMGEAVGAEQPSASNGIGRGGRGPIAEPKSIPSAAGRGRRLTDAKEKTTVHQPAAENDVEENARPNRKPSSPPPATSQPIEERNASTATAKFADAREYGDDAARERAGVERLGVEFVGPLRPDDFEATDLVTCVVTIRPASALDEPTAPSEVTPASQPAGGASRG